MNIRDIIAGHLKRSREQAGLSPEEAAAMIVVPKDDRPVSGSYIRRLEKSKNSPTVEHLHMIVRVYGLNLGSFFAGLPLNGKKGKPNGQRSIDKDRIPDRNRVSRN